jgi:hypothetical protein
MIFEEADSLEKSCSVTLSGYFSTNEGLLLPLEEDCFMRSPMIDWMEKCFIINTIINSHHCDKMLICLMSGQ